MKTCMENKSVDAVELEFGLQFRVPSKIEVFERHCQAEAILGRMAYAVLVDERNQRNLFMVRSFPEDRNLYCDYNWDPLYSNHRDTRDHRHGYSKKKTCPTTPFQGMRWYACRSTPIVLGGFEIPGIGYPPRLMRDLYRRHCSLKDPNPTETVEFGLDRLRTAEKWREMVDKEPYEVLIPDDANDNTETLVYHFKSYNIRIRWAQQAQIWCEYALKCLQTMDVPARYTMPGVRIEDKGPLKKVWNGVFSYSDRPGKDLGGHVKEIVTEQLWEEESYPPANEIPDGFFSRERNRGVLQTVG